jgi:tetratricopeptide (TPR) repeat protein
MLQGGTAAVAAGVGLIGVVGVASASGGYFQTSWGWSALAMAWAAALAFLLRSEHDFGWLDAAYLGLVGLFVGWIWLSATWSQAAPKSILEGERGLVALTGVAAGLAIVSRRSVPHLLGAVAGGISLIAAYALATRLFPDKVGTFDSVASYRLEAPLGYWNALGIFAVIGALLCLGFAARGRTYVGRALAAGALAILVPTLYFTYSRGSWFALAVGLTAALLLDPRRLQLVTALVVLAPVPALEVWLASRKPGLTHDTVHLAAAVHDGKRYVLIVLVCALVTAALAALLTFAERRFAVPSRVRAAYAAVVGLVVVAALAGVFVHYGSPTHIAKRGWDSFKTPMVATSSNLNQRLLSFSGNGRVDLWTAAWHDHNEHPLLGSGAGTFQEYWYQHRPNDKQAIDAHSLYAETLGEMGPLGLALIGLALLVPAAAAVLARGQPLVPVAFAAYVAYLVHAGLDWDWEMTAVTLSALLVGVGLVASARGREPRAISSRLRYPLVAGTVAVAALAFVVLVGNLKLARAQHALARSDLGKAAAEARSASNWAPWSAQALTTLGSAESKLGQKGQAAATVRAALRKEPKDSDLWYRLYLLTQGAEANRAFATAVRLDPLDFDLKDRRSVLGRSTG